MKLEEKDELSPDCEKDERSRERDDFDVVILHTEEQFELAEAICENIRNIDLGTETQLRVESFGNILTAGQQETDTFNYVIENSCILVFIRNKEFFEDKLNGFAVSAIVEDRVRNNDRKRHWTFIPVDVERKTKIKGKAMINSLKGIVVSAGGDIDESDQEKLKDVLLQKLPAGIEKGPSDVERTLTNARSRQVKDINSLVPSPGWSLDRQSTQPTNSGRSSPDRPSSSLGNPGNDTLSSPEINSEGSDPSSQRTQNDLGSLSSLSNAPAVSSLSNANAFENSAQNSSHRSDVSPEREATGEETMAERSCSQGLHGAVLDRTADAREPAKAPSPLNSLNRGRTDIHAEESSSLTTSVEADNPGPVSHHQRPLEGGGIYHSDEAKAPARQQEPGGEDETFTEQQQSPGCGEPWPQQQPVHNHPAVQQRQGFKQQLQQQQPPYVQHPQDDWNNTGARPETYLSSSTAANPPGENAPDACNNSGRGIALGSRDSCTEPSPQATGPPQLIVNPPALTSSAPYTQPMTVPTESQVCHAFSGVDNPPTRSELTENIVETPPTEQPDPICEADAHQAERRPVAVVMPTPRMAAHYAEDENTPSMTNRAASADPRSESPSEGSDDALVVSTVHPAFSSVYNSETGEFSLT